MALRRRKRPKPQDDLHAWARQLNDDAEERRKPHEGVWWENLATYAGDLWVEWDPHSSMLRENKPSGDHKVRIPINLAQPIVRTEYAKLVKNKPILDILAKSNDEQDLNSAKVGDRMMQYAEKHFALPRVRRRAVWWTLVCGQGGIFVDYDPKAVGEVQVLAGPDGNPVFDERMVAAIQRHYRKQKKAPRTISIPQGDLRPRALSPFQYVFDMSQIYLEDAWWCIVNEAYDVDEVFRRWDKEIEGDQEVQPGVIERRILAKSDRTGALQAKSTTSQPMVKVSRLFIKPGHRYFPDGAEIVFCDECIIDHQDFPYAHGQLPLSVMGHIPYGITQNPLSVLTQIRGPVLEASRTVSQLTENRNLMANPPWLVPKQLKMNKDFENRPGLRLEYNHMPNVPPPGPVEMPEMPMYVQNLLETFKSSILEISGQGETSQGRVPAGARSGVAIAYLQEEDDTKLGPTVQEFEEMIERSHLQILKGFAQFYDAPRTIQIYKRNSEPEVFDFMGSQLNGVASLEVQAGSALPRSKAAKQQFVLDLFDRGLIQDPAVVKEWLELSQGEPDEAEIDKSQAERENRDMDAGNFESVDCLEWYNHPMHHLVHRRRMKQPDFKDLPQEVQQAYLRHDEEHSVFERQQMQTQMVQQQLGGGGSNGNGGPPQLNAANGMNNQGLPPQFAADLGAGSQMEAPPQ